MANELGFEAYEIKEYPSLEEELMNKLMNGNFSLKNDIIKSELGETYQYYKQINHLKNLEHVQCRMEEIVIK